MKNLTEIGGTMRDLEGNDRKFEVVKGKYEGNVMRSMKKDHKSAKLIL